MKTPTDCPLWLTELLDGFSEEVETKMFAATDPGDISREAIRLSMVRMIQREIELKAEVEEDSIRKQNERLFDAKRAS